MVCIPAWSIYKLRTLKGPLREVGGKHWGIGTSLMTGGLLSKGAGVQREITQPGVGTKVPEEEPLGVLKRDTG